MAATTLHRSYLYVPGDRPDRLEKALASAADAVIADLEDAVAPAGKAEARSAIAEVLRSDRADGPEVLVRINNDDQLGEDLAAVIGAGVGTVYLPKADSASLGRLLAELGPSDTQVVALIESARGLLDAAALAATSGVRNLAIGEADLTAELGIEPSDDRREMWPLRSQLVVASAAAGIDPPTGPVSTDFRDLDDLREDTEALRRAGFVARSAIHPAQLEVINEVFTPSDAEVQRASRLVELFEESVARGDGACVDDEGRMVDEAVVRSARRVLARGRRTP
ncbi:MAG: CoA ester lyase [Actinomycetia bacterium]|nr:CoA ester lyase [Actinomycetes bacterium]